MTEKPLAFIIGAYPKKPVYGGFVTDCIQLRRSFIYERFTVIEFDSCMISNPPPNLIIRLFLSFKRLWRLAALLHHIPPVNLFLIFFPSGVGALEKLTIALLVKKVWVQVPVVMLPRAGDWFKELPRYPKFFLNALSGSGLKWAVQGVVGLETIKRYLPAAVTTIVPPFIETMKLTTSELAKYRQAEKVRFVFVGWLEESKGVSSILSLLARNKFDLEFFFIGDGRQSAEVSKACVSDKRITHVGWVTKNKVFEYFKDADVLVLPSKAEGFPNVVAEAMVSGLALAVSDVGEIKTFVSEDQLFPVDKFELFEALIQRYVSDRKFLNERKLDNFKIASSSFGINKLDYEICRIMGYS
jgi:glycosyltransferase involved in cell wall biosynthesis